MTKTANEQAPLIMLDGPEWIGKTTQLRLLADELQRRRMDVYVTRVHGGTAIGETLRAITLNPDLERPPETNFYLLLATYYALITDLAKRRQTCDVCLVDRSPLSILAYQVAGSGFDAAEGERATQRTFEAFAPNLVICYDASDEALRARHRQRQLDGKTDHFESQPEEYMARVNESYRQNARRYRAEVIEASGSIDSVHQATMQCVYRYFPEFKA